jgi:hypothetical protein
MQSREFQYATIGLANTRDIRGRVTADEMNCGLRRGEAKRRIGWIACCRLCAAALVLFPVGQAIASDEDHDGQFLPAFISSSTVPANGDINPYGVAFVPKGFPTGKLLKPGDVLVSNFNNNGNVQGTGTTIIKLTPDGKVVQSGSAALFFQGKSGLGLTTALGALKRGFVLVGSVPTIDGTFATIQPGSLLILDSSANVVTTLTKANLLDSPWDLTIQDGGDFAKVFVSNVVTGTVTRLNLAVISGKPVVIGTTQIAKGYMVQANPAAVILGPTGLAYDAEEDVLYVASTADNAIFAVPNAGIRANPPQNGRGANIFHDNHLRGPLGLVLASNGHLITSNGDAVNGDATQPSELVEFTKEGKFIGQSNVDPAQGGAFGIAVTAPWDQPVRFAAVDDNASDIVVHTLKTEK